MATFYTGVDKERYDAGNKYVPMDQFLLDYKTPTTNVEEEVTTSYGIPNTNAFINSGGGGGGSGPTTVFSPYTAQSPTSYITNRTNFGNTGYIQGTEPEENYMDKVGGLIKKGIGMAIPGGNFLMGMVENQNRNNRLNAADNAFIDMQIANQEQSMHGGNLPNQDRYGYNKVSMFGNYADLVSKHATAALAKPEDKRTNFDNYYLEKQKEQDEIDKQIEFNDWMNQRITANKIRAAQEEGVDLGPSGIDIHGGDKTTTTNTTTNTAPQRGGGQGDSSPSHMGGISQAQADAVGAANEKAGMGGWGLADGGRAGYKRGRVVNPGGYAGDEEGGIVEWLKSKMGIESETNPTVFGTQDSFLNRGSINKLQNAIKSYEAMMHMGELDEEQLADYELKLAQLQALEAGAQSKADGGIVGFKYGGLASIL